MKFRSIPHTDLIVSEIGARFDGVLSAVPSERTDLLLDRLLRLAYDHGVTFFDLTDSTGQGRAERAFARVLKDARANTLVAVRVQVPSDSPVSPVERLRQECERSLRRLESDVLDVLIVDGVSEEWLLSGALAQGFLDLREAGLIRAGGFHLAGAAAGFPKTIIEQSGAALISAEFGWRSIASFRHCTPALETPERRPAMAIALDDDVTSDAFAFLWSDTGRTPVQAAACYALTKPWVGTVVMNLDSDTAIADAALVPTVPALTDAEITVIESLSVAETVPAGNHGQSGTSRS